MYSYKEYGEMYLDRVRVRPYVEALRRVVHQDSVVVDLGAGPGLFSLISLSLGARKVYSIDPSPSVLDLPDLVEDNGLDRLKVEVFQSISTQVRLPEQADVVVSDLRGLLPLHGAHLEAIIDAKTRFLKPGGVCIPTRDSIWVSLCSSDRMHKLIVDPWISAEYGVRFSRLLPKALGGFRSFDKTEEDQLWPPSLLGTLDYSTLIRKDFAGQCSLESPWEGCAHGLVVWFDATIWEDLGYSNSPFSQNCPTSYSAVFFPFQEPMLVPKGGSIEIWLKARPGKVDYEWDWGVSIAGGARRSFSSLGGNPMEQSSVNERLVPMLRQGVVKNPGHAPLRRQLALNLIAQHSFHEAVIQLSKALELEKDADAELQNLDKTIRHKLAPERACCRVAYLREIVEHRESKIAVIESFVQSGKCEAAELLCWEVLANEPECSEVLSLLAECLISGRVRKPCFSSFASVASILAQKEPGSFRTCMLLGRLGLRKNDVLEAVTQFRAATDQRPHDAEAHFNLAWALLLSGQCEQGWQEYEWRLRGLYNEFYRPNTWDGSNLNGKVLLVEEMQGDGDWFFFLRYLALARQRSALIAIECQCSLLRLLQHSGLVDMVFLPEHGVPVQVGAKVWMSSLPALLQTGTDTVAREIPYLRAVSRDVQRFSSLFSGIPQFKVGLVWAGNAKYAQDSIRSLPLNAFSTLQVSDKVCFYSLQVGDSNAVAFPPQPLEIRDLTGYIADWADTAAMIENLDLIISVDTGVAHLAGAMGKPVWMLSRFAPDWRWGLDSEETPWYPTMRIFRQKTEDDWLPVIDRVRSELCIEVENYQNKST